MKIRNTPDIEKLQFEVKYESGIMSIIDWIAGGNFVGYVYKKQLIFYKTENKVRLQTIILNQERSDSKIENTIIEGIFSATDHNTISCNFENMNMRGKILGAEHEFIAFSVTYPNWNRGTSECYHLKK